MRTSLLPFHAYFVLVLHNFGLSARDIQLPSSVEYSRRPAMIGTAHPGLLLQALKILKWIDVSDAQQGIPSSRYTVVRRFDALRNFILLLDR